ncbi:MAG: PQQ-binding-like beta-propeller repeat protein [Myxococcota bacterium]
MGTHGVAPLALACVVLCPQLDAQEASPAEGWSTRVAQSWLRTPAYADGRVFVGGGIGSRDFYAFDARTGEELWRTRVSDVGPTAALVHRGRVIFGSESCHVHVLDAETGAIVWERFLGDPLTAAPSVGGGRVYAAYLAQAGWSLAALDLASGEPVWNLLLGHNVIDAPVYHQEALYLATTDGSVRAIDADTGRPRWTRAVDALGAPTRVGDEIHVVAWPQHGDQPIRLRFQLRGYDPGYAEVFAQLEERLNALGACAWSEPVRVPLQLQEGRVRADVSGAPEAAQECLRASLGKMRVPPDDTGVHELLLSRGRQHIARLDAASGEVRPSFGEVLLGRVPEFAARGGGSWLWSYEGPRVLADGDETIELVGDRIRLRQSRSLLGDQQLRWSQRVVGGATLPAITDEHLVFGSEHAIVVRSRRSGETVREVPIEGRLASQPVVANGWVIATTRDGRLLGRPMRDVLNPSETYAMWGGSADRAGR